MHVRTGIIAATTVTALWTLALPAHAGAGAGAGVGGDLTVTASQCTSGQGMVVDGFCEGGNLSGASVSG